MTLRMTPEFPECSPTSSPNSAVFAERIQLRSRHRQVTQVCDVCFFFLKFNLELLILTQEE